MRCKRCGTKFEALDHLCTGCGKSIMALRSDNEIIYDEDELSQVEIEKQNILSMKNEVVSEPVVPTNDSLDIFGDAIFNEKSINNSSVSENRLNDNILPVNEKIDDFEVIEIVEPIYNLKEEIYDNDLVSNNEVINMETLDKRNDDVILKTIVTNNITPTEIKVSKKSKLPLILGIIALVLLVIAIILFFYSKSL